MIEVKRGNESVVFCVERAMEEGGYVKYNNNSGFVEYAAEGVPAEEGHRLTPHAFSRFSFDASGGKLMIVDIQGVDDVYTDPQIHTLCGKDYGEGRRLAAVQPPRGRRAAAAWPPCDRHRRGQPVTASCRRRRRGQPRRQRDGPLFLDLFVRLPLPTARGA